MSFTANDYFLTVLQFLSFCNDFSSVLLSVPNCFSSVLLSVPSRFISVFLSFYFATWHEFVWTIVGEGYLIMVKRKSISIDSCINVFNGLSYNP
jgi:hypothetical protein